MSKSRLAVVVAVALLLGGPWAFVRLWPDRADQVAFPAIGAGAEPYRVFLVNWGYHTSLVLPQPHGLSLGPVDDAEAPYVEFAWGDRSFYMESNFWPHRLFATVLLPTPTVTYIAGWSKAPSRTDGMLELWSRSVTPEELTRLYAAVEGSIRHNPAHQRADAYPPAEGYRGRFYPAHGYFLFWSDCNRWTLDQLHSAGLAESGAGVIFARQVAARLHGFRRE